MAHGVLRLNCPAASTTVPAMKKPIILVSALSVVVMALVSCASNSDVDHFRARTERTTPEYHEPAPAHHNIGGTPHSSTRLRPPVALAFRCVLAVVQSLLGLG